MKLTRILIFSLVVVLLILIPLFNFRFLVFNKAYYAVALDNSAEAHEVIDYLQGKGELSGFTEKEEEHLFDVKNLIGAAIIIFYLLIILMILLFSILYFSDNFWSNIRKVFLFSSATIIFLSLILYLLPFDFLFEKFHFLFFEENSWIFSPTSKIINIFPQKFFYGIFYKIIFNSFIFSVGVLAILFFSNKKYKPF